MKMLIIESIASQNWGAILVRIAPIVVIWGVVLVAMICDLVSGIKKAVELGELRTSLGLRRTVSKACEYFQILLFAFLMDILIGMIFPMPIVSLIAAGFLVWIEFMSIREKADVKQRKKMSGHIDSYAKLLSSISAKDPKKAAEIVAAISEVLNTSNNSENDKAG